MHFWTEQNRRDFIDEALKSFRWVPCAFVMLLVEETGACPYKIAKLSFSKFDLDVGKVRIGRYTYQLSHKLTLLLRQQKERLSFQAKAFPVFRQTSMKWVALSPKELDRDILSVKRGINLPLHLGVSTLRVSVFRDRINKGELPTVVAGEMHLSSEEFERFWRLVTNV